MPQKIKPLIIDSKINENTYLELNISNKDDNLENEGILSKINSKSELWINKYCPKTTDTIKSNKESIKKIKYWLKNFYKSKNKDICIVISGVHGIGKTLITKLIMKECKYNMIYFNSFSSKKKDNIDNRVMKYFINETIRKREKKCIIIDESENISLTSEKNAINEMYKENNLKKYFPLIFITNTQHNKLICDIKKNSKTYDFEKPSKDDLLTLLVNVEKKENFKIDRKAINELFTFCQFDYRRFLVILQDIYFTYNCKIIKAKYIKEFINNNNKKNEEISLFDATKFALEKYSNFTMLQELYLNEKVLLPLMIHENYLKFMFLNYKCKNNDIYMKIMKNISDSISWGDVIETSIYTDQNWFLQENIHAFYTTINTSYHLNKYNSVAKLNSPLISFSSDLNKTSLKNINRKNIMTLKKSIMNKNLDDLIFINKLVSDLVINKKFDEVKKVRLEYNLSIKDIEIILKLNKMKEKITLTSKMKKLIT